MTKISLQELKKMFFEYQPGRYKPMKATKPGFVHTHTPHYMPPASEMTPKRFEERTKEQKKILASGAKKNFLYQCLDCLTPMGKLGYCYEHKKWASLIPVKE